jgi:phosphoribosylformylglycinamidine cyclo-ligase
MATACRANGCALLGGETAEMPGFYNEGEYDLAGFIVGVVDRAHLISGRGVAAGDVLVGVPSSGLHTNGYSLARRVVFEHLGLQVGSYVPALSCTVGEALLEPHRSYLPVIGPLLQAGRIKAMAHITGGGITDNLPRVLPQGLAAVIDRRSWQVPPIFAWLAQNGQIPEAEMFRAFNMGIGLIVVTARDRADALLGELAARGGRDSRVIGELVPGQSPEVQYI